MNCFRVRIPDGMSISGMTADGRCTDVLPGEYLVHLLRPRGAPVIGQVHRFVGADKAGRDVHVPGIDPRLSELLRLESNGFEIYGS